ARGRIQLDGVAVAAAVDNVAVDKADDGVVAGLAVDMVDAAAAGDPVGAGPGIDGVAGRGAGEGVTLGAAGDSEAGGVALPRQVDLDRARGPGRRHRLDIDDVVVPGEVEVARGRIQLDG